MVTPESRTAATPGSRPKRNRIIIGAAAFVVVGLAVTAAMVWKTLSHRPPSPKGDPVTIARFITTPDFAQMTLEQKAEYLKTLRSNMPMLVEAARAGKFTREEQIAAVRNGVKVGARVEMYNYFRLPEGPARKAHLDKLIEEQETLRGYARHARQGGGPLQFSGGVELKQFVESLPPGERIQMAQFGFELFNRRRERGLPLWPYGQ